MKLNSIFGKRKSARRRASLWSRLALASMMILGVFGSAHAVPQLTASLEDATNGGGFFAVVTLEDTAPNTVTVTADIADPINVGLTQGDVLAIYFDVSNFALLSGLTAGAGNPTTLSLALTILENSVTQVPGPNTNINGTHLKFDLGVALGTNGSTAGYIQTLSFNLVGAAGFSTATFLDQNIGLRVQSIEGGTYMNGSSKLTNAVPVPGTLALLGAGMLGFSIVRRRKSTAAS